MFTNINMSNITSMKHLGIVLVGLMTGIISYPLYYIAFIFVNSSGEQIAEFTSMQLVLIYVFTFLTAVLSGWLFYKFGYKFILYAFLSIFALFILFPFYWMIITSLKSYEEVIRPYPTLFPQKIVFSNFIDAMEDFNYFSYVKSTLIVAVASTVFTLISTILTAFAFARLKFKGSGILFSLLLSTMMIPGEMYVITNYITVSKLDLLNSYAVLVIPFIVSMFYIFLLRQSFKQIPDTLYWAAKVDGTSDFKYLRRIMVPIAMPSIITIIILKVIGTWNAYVWPNLVTTQEKYYLISNGLRNTTFGDNTDLIPHIELSMAAALLVSIPLIIVFILLKKYIMRSVGNAGVKG